MTSSTSVIDLVLEVGVTTGRVSAILLRPPDAFACCVMAHGAGAGMRHPFLEGLAERLAARRVATFRYQFPYMERGRRAPDVPNRLIATVRAAVAEAAQRSSGLPLVAGGKSLGGRMTSTAAAREALPGVHGLVFFGFPLHAPNKPDRKRAAHLFDVSHPMLFLQGTRDGLADLSLLKPVVSQLGSRATLHIVDGGDHSFRVLKRSGRTDAEVMAELADTAARWTRGVVEDPA